MPQEIERKFLIRDEGWRAAVGKSVRIRQGYLNGHEGRASIRVRVQDDEGRLNIKAAVIGNSRAEYDYGIPIEEASEILETLSIGRVDKTRHHVHVSGHLWEIDEFDGANRGLIVAEIELKDVNEPFEKPAWLGAEVTDERQYYNHALAFHPYCEWTRATGR